jgi:hypothetical protein
MSELRDDAEDLLDEAALGRAAHTPVTVHALMIVVIGVVFVVVCAITLALYLVL